MSERPVSAPRRAAVAFIFVTVVLDVLAFGIIIPVLPGQVAYDVGANIGYISILLARSVGENGRVFAFEALPANLERLHHNISLNGMSSRVTVVPGAT